MRKIIGRIINYFSNKSEDIFIIHSEKKKCRLIIKKGSIDITKFTIGDIVEFSGKLVTDGKYSAFFDEYCCSKISILKKTMLSKTESAINDSNKFKGNKSKQYYHTKMILDDGCITNIKVYDLVVNSIRKDLKKHKFIECRTPILTNNFHGGGAFPFETYVNAKHKKCYLRANSILPLSMYLAGGLERVYEIGEYFRNGSITKTHSVPYLATEIYSTNISYTKMLELSISLFTNIINKVCMEHNFSLSSEIKIISFEEFMRKNEYRDFSMCHLDEYFKYKKINYSINNYENINVLYRILKEEIVPRYQETIIITNLPSGISPFIDDVENNNKLLKRSLFFFKGHTIMEIAYSSNNYEEIQKKISEQIDFLSMNNKSEVDKECEGYEHALKLGILPMSSITISLERFVSLICSNDNISDYMIEI